MNTSLGHSSQWAPTCATTGLCSHEDSHTAFVATVQSHPARPEDGWSEDGLYMSTRPSTNLRCQVVRHRGAEPNQTRIIWSVTFWLCSDCQSPCTSTAKRYTFWQLSVPFPATEVKRLKVKFEILQKRISHRRLADSAEVIGSGIKLGHQPTLRVGRPLCCGGNMLLATSEVRSKE
jgi:hypothetical protein